MLSNSRGDDFSVWFCHLHHVVRWPLVSELPQAVDEALAGLTVDSACLQHGLALFHKLEEDTNEATNVIAAWIIKQKPNIMKQTEKWK